VSPADPRAGRSRGVFFPGSAVRCARGSAGDGGDVWV